MKVLAPVGPKTAQRPMKHPRWLYKNGHIRPETRISAGNAFDFVHSDLILEESGCRTVNPGKVQAFATLG